ncbi:MAG: site-specific integrase [Nitrososphaerales archaeon]
MINKIDIHGFEVRLERAERKLHNPLSRMNTELVKNFEKALFSEGLSLVRVEKYVNTLRKIGEMLGKDFDKASKKDIEDLVYKIERSGYSPWTKHDYKVALKKFYKWLKGNNEEYPEEVRWIKTTLKEKDLLLPEQLLTEDEVMKLVDAASNPRDKAFIITLYESGARIGELGSMRIRDVSFEENYARLMLKGKTGSRRVIVIASSPYLATWIQNHPLKNDPDAPLWVNIGTVNRYEAMSYPALAKILRVVTERASLSKKVHPHKLRHSRATFLASKLTEAQMNQVFGWKQGSDMPSIYVHLSGRDLDDAILGVYGLKKIDEEKPKLIPKICPRCNASNPIDAKFCIKCGLALDMKAAQEMEEARAKTDNMMNLLMKDPEFKEFLMRKLKELGPSSL